MYQLLLTVSLGSCIIASSLLAEGDPPPPIEVRTATELHEALKSADPGTTINVHAGTYEGIFFITRSGRPGQPITLQPAGDGPVRLAPPSGVKFTPTSRKSASGPNLERTLRISDATDIVIRDLSIHGGILIGNPNSLKESRAWKEADQAVAAWSESEAAADAPESARQIAKIPWIRTVAYWRGRIGPGFVGWMDGKLPPTAQRVTVKNCDLTGRGIALWQASACRLEKNTIHDVEEANCGILLQFLCSHNEIIGNDISGMYDPQCHWHGEGIRLVNGSCYNLVADNSVHDIRGLGFGITTDLFCDFNTILNNRVSNIQNIAFTGQAWDSDNKWVNNVAENANIGFEFSSWWWEDEPTNQPTSNVEVRGNRAVRCTNADAVAARIHGFRFVNNDFKVVHFSPKLIETFAAAGGLWDGSPELPDWISTAPPKRDLKFEY